MWDKKVKPKGSVLKKEYWENFQEIEQKWQKKWSKTAEENKNERNFENNISAKEKFYCLGQFPYPSGTLHLGHGRVYTICDLLTRFENSRGKNVINPIGWDAFGLPAENAAIENKVSASDWTQMNIKKMKGDLIKLGFLFDWDMELSTNDEQYYKWTQWIF